MRDGVCSSWISVVLRLTVYSLLIAFALCSDGRAFPLWDSHAGEIMPARFGAVGSMETVVPDEPVRILGPEWVKFKKKQIGQLQVGLSGEMLAPRPELRMVCNGVVVTAKGDELKLWRPLGERYHNIGTVRPNGLLILHGTRKSESKTIAWNFRDQEGRLELPPVDTVLGGERNNGKKRQAPPRHYVACFMPADQGELVRLPDPPPPLESIVYLINEGASLEFIHVHNGKRETYAHVRADRRFEPVSSLAKEHMRTLEGEDPRWPYMDRDGNLIAPNDTPSIQPSTLTSGMKLYKDDLGWELIPPEF